MQTGLTAFMRLYPAKRGLVTGVFYFFGALASFTVPIITGSLSKQSVEIAFNGNVIVGLTAVIVVSLIALLMRHVNHLAEK
jgi:MFS family permease